MTRPQSLGSVPIANGSYGQGSNPNIGLGRPPTGRDPKSRARSREYLKQCLQEITYLTSPQAVNPLPNRPILSMAGNATTSNLPVSIPNLPTFSIDFAAQQPSQSQATQQTVQPLSQPGNYQSSQTGVQQSSQTPGTIQLTAANGRPRKVVPDVDRDTFIGNEPADDPSDSERTLATIPDSPSELSEDVKDPGTGHAQEHVNSPTSDPSAGKQLGSPPQLTLHHTDSEGDASINSNPSDTGADTMAMAAREPSQLTSIFRPDDDGQRGERSRAAHVNINQSQLNSGRGALGLNFVITMTVD